MPVGMADRSAWQRKGESKWQRGAEAEDWVGLCCMLIAGPAAPKPHSP